MDALEKAETPDREQPNVAEKNKYFDQETGIVITSKDGIQLFPQPITGDKLDPLNWSGFQKHAILAIVMALYFMFTYVTTTTVPSFPDLQEKYSASLDQVNWTVAIPALGLALGPLMWASIADIIGRRPVFITGTVIALASSVGAALAPNYSSYMAARFFQGFGVSPASNVGLAILNDIFFDHERGAKVGLWVLAIDLGLFFGPLIGGFVLLAGYTWIQWVTAIVFGFILVAEIFFLPETLYPRTVMAASSSMEASKEMKRTKEISVIRIGPVPGVQHPKPYETLVQFIKMFKNPVVSIPVITYCFAWYWWVLSVVTLIPTAYVAFSAQIQGLLFLGLIIGTLLSEIFCSGRLSDWLVIKVASRHGGRKTPETRLWLAYPAALLTSVGLIVWGVSIDQEYHWVVGQVASALFGAGIQMGNAAICAYVCDACPTQTMAVMTFYSVMLNLSAFVDPFFIVPWVQSAGFTWTFAGHAIITSCFCIPVIALVHRFGNRSDPGLAIQ